MPERVAKRVKKAAGGQPVSAWLTELIEEHLEDAELERQWLAFLRDVCPSGHDSRQADALFHRLTKPPKRRRAA